MDWLRLALVLLVLAGTIEAQQGYSYPKPKTTFSDNSQPGSIGGSSTPNAQPISGTSQTPFGVQQSTGSYPSGDQPGIPSGSQSSAGFPGSGQPGVPSGTQRPFGTQQPFRGYPSTSQPEGQQSSPGYPGSVQPGAHSGTQGAFGTQQSSRPGVFGTAQQSTSGYPGFETPSGTQRPLGTQQPSGAYPSGAQSGGSGESQQPFGGYSGSEQSGTPGGTQRPFGTHHASGAYPNGAQSGVSSDSQRPFGGYSGSEQPGAPSGAQKPFGTQLPSSGSQASISGGVQQPFGGYPGSGQSGEPAGATASFRSQQPSSSYSGPAQSGTQGSFGARQPGYSSSGRQELSPAFSGKPGTGRPVDAQQPGYQRSGAQGRTADSQRPGIDAPSTNGRPQGSYPGQNQRGYNYPTPQSPLNGADQSSGVRPGTPSFRQRPGVPLASASPFGAAGTAGTSQFGAEKPLGGYPTSSEKRPSSQQFPTSSYTPSGGEQQRPSGNVQNQETLGKRGRGEFSGEGQFPVGQIDRSRFEGTTERQFPSSGATQFGGQQSSRGPSGYSQTGPQFTTGSSERPDSLARPTGQVNGYSDSTIQQGSPAFESNGKSDRPQLPSGIPQGKSSSTRYPESDQRPLSSYLPPGGRGTGDLPLDDSPASQFPSNGFASVGSRRPSTSRISSGRSEEPTGYKNGFGTSAQPTGGRSFNGKSSQRPEESISSQNGYNTPSTPAKVSTGFTQSTEGVSFNDKSSRRPGQPSSSQNEYNVPSVPTARVAGSRGLQFPSGPQVINGYSRAPQQADRPGAIDALDSRPTFDGTNQEGFSRRINDQTFPGSPQGSRDFIPGQGKPSDEDEGDYSAIPGEPGRDYPIFSDVPETSFDCDDQEYRGYYADVEARCQIFHICANNKTYDFLCPNGTVFHQEHLVCVWWNQFDCDTAPSLYRVNEHIYDYSIFGAQQTGGIPMSGQDYPELREGFPLEGASGTGTAGQAPQRPGIGFGGDARRPAGYPSEGSQGPTGYGSRPNTEVQRVRGYSDGRSLEPTGGYPSVGTEGQSSGGLQKPSGVQRPGAYPSEIPQGNNGGYSGATVQGKEEYPSEGLQRSGGGIQSTGGYPSERPQSNGRPQGAGEFQFPGQESQRPTGSVQGVEGPFGTTSTGYPQRPSNGKTQTQSYPSERPGSSQISAPGQRPGQYEGEGVSGPESTAVSQPGDYPQDTGRRPGTSQGYGVPSQRPGAPSSQESTSAGSPSGFQSSPNGSGSPFGGSPQPRQPTRDYLPPV